MDRRTLGTGLLAGVVAFALFRVGVAFIFWLQDVWPTERRYGQVGTVLGVVVYAAILGLFIACGFLEARRTPARSPVVAGYLGALPVAPVLLLLVGLWAGVLDVVVSTEWLGLRALLGAVAIVAALALPGVLGIPGGLLAAHRARRASGAAVA